MAQPLTPWVALKDVLLVYAPELLDPDTGEIIGDPAEVAKWQAAIDSATWMMWALAGGKLHPEEDWIEEYSLAGSCEVIPLNGPLLTVLAAEMIESCPHATSGTVLEFCVDYQRINFCCGVGPRRGRCGCGEQWVRIFYRTANTLPPGTEGRVAWFANQYMLSVNGDKACSLPERITSVTRQGVSWSMLDPMDFLDKRLTGVGRLDSWLAAVRLVYPSATLIDPLLSQRRNSRRLSSTTANEVFVASTNPAVYNPQAELWYQDDDAAPAAAADPTDESDEVVIGTTDPGAPTELWYDPSTVP